MKLTYLTKQEYLEKTKKLEGGHWTPETIDIRWDYHSKTIELIKAMNLNSSFEVLEMGTMGVTCLNDSHTIDYIERWDFEGKQPFYVHDARIIPWPINSKKYELFVALRVFQHLVPKQQECVKEAMRISKKVIIVVPDKYNNPVLPDAKGINYVDFVRILEGIHPNLFIPTSFGYLYYWDTENPSNLDIEKVMDNVLIHSYKNIENIKLSNNFDIIAKKILKKLKMLLK